MRGEAEIGRSDGDGDVGGLGMRWAGGLGGMVSWGWGCLGGLLYLGGEYWLWRKAFDWGNACGVLREGSVVWYRGRARCLPLNQQVDDLTGQEPKI